MEKISLKYLNIDTTAMLTKEQLKNVFADNLVPTIF